MAKEIFTLLDSRLQRELKSLEFQEPTPIQIEAIPRILKGETVLLIAPTGHGKTEAAFLPILNRLLLDPPSTQGIQILWITPLRALNRDILRRLVLIAENLKVSAEVRHGDTRAAARRRQTLEPPTLLVTTPETLQAILAGKRMRENLRTVRCVVIDEVHELASSKRGVQLTVALERLRHLTAGPFQRIGLSATVGNPVIISEFMAGENPCNIIESPALKEFEFRVEYYPFHREQPDGSPLDGPASRIWELVNQHQSTLIFCNERQTAEALAIRLAKLQGDDAGVHHGSLSRTARIETEKRFKAGEIPFLVCTSSLELGLDIGSVDLVIQYGSPRQVVRLLQRVGRSGHQLDKTSKGVILTTRFDDIVESVTIIREARKGFLETPPIHYEALDILGHQLVGLTIEYKTIPLQQAFSIIKRATPFKNLELSTVHRVLNHLEREGLVARDEDIIRPRRKSYPYYFENLSVIPDIPYHHVINLATGKAVGRLDAGFADEYGQTGNIIVLRGRPWEVVKREEAKLFVTPAGYSRGKIPRWSGELIPVSREVAMGVGHLWKQVAEKQKKGRPIPFNVEIEVNAKHEILNTIEKQCEHGFLPNRNLVMVEESFELVVIHSCFGTRINETLGRLLAALVTTKLGIELGFHSDHYRILFRFEQREGSAIGEAITEELKTLHPEHMRELLQMALLRSPYFSRRFLHTARRFGVISRDADLTSRQLLRLMQYFADTPVLEEALQEFFVEKLDIDGTAKILEDLARNKIQLELIYSRRPSPFSRQILARFGEFLEPEVPEAFVLEQTQRRLENRRVKLVCLHCAQWVSVRTIKHLKKHPKCPKCNSRLIAGVFPTDEILEQAIRRLRAGKKLTPEESKALRKGRENADLVLNYGSFALIAMAARGVGPTIAKRILAASHGRGKHVLYRLILESEKQFIRTREWWADDTPK